MAITILIATIIDSVRSFICLLWLNVATAMRTIVIGSVVITTNVLTKAIILPSIFNILDRFVYQCKVSDYIDNLVLYNGLFISISLQFSPNWSVFLPIPQKFLANSLHVQIFISTFAIATILVRSTPHEQRARRYVQAQPTFSKRCGLIFLPITCRIDTRVFRPLFMRSTPHGVEMPRQNTAVRLPRVF